MPVVVPMKPDAAPGRERDRGRRPRVTSDHAEPDAHQHQDPEQHGQAVGAGQCDGGGAGEAGRDLAGDGPSHRVPRAVAAVAPADEHVEDERHDDDRDRDEIRVDQHQDRRRDQVDAEPDRGLDHRAGGEHEEGDDPSGEAHRHGLVGAVAVDRTFRARHREGVAPFVPVVDISQWTEGDAARTGIAAEVDDACRTLGFLQIAGHGIDATTIESMLGAADAIFALPDAAKLAMTAPPHINRGYAPVGSESLTYSLGVDAPPDLFEAFNIGPDLVPVDDPIYAAQLEGVFAPNIWPPDLPGARAGLVAYFAEVSALARRLISIFAVALGLPEDHFVADVRPRHRDAAAQPLRTSARRRGAAAGSAAHGRAHRLRHRDRALRRPRAGSRDRGSRRRVARRGPGAGRVPRQPRRPPGPVDERPVALDRPPGRARRRERVRLDAGRRPSSTTATTTRSSSASRPASSRGEPPRYPPVVAGEHLTAKLLSGRSRSVEPRADVIDTIGERIEAVTRDLDP